METLKTDWNHFGYSICFDIRPAKNPGNIANCSPSHHCSKGADLGYFFGAILLANIMNNFVTSIILKVNVNIRQCRSIKIQEALKRQFKVKRIYIGNTNRIGNKTAGD